MGILVKIMSILRPVNINTDKLSFSSSNMSEVSLDRIQVPNDRVYLGDLSSRAIQNDWKIPYQEIGINEAPRYDNRQKIM